MAALVAAAGFRSSTGALLVPLEEEFGWSRATTSGAVSLNLILYGLTAPFAAALMERFGVAPGRGRGAAAGGRRVRADPGDDRRVAALAAVGLRGRDRHRLAGAGVRGDRGEPLVREAPRRRDRRLLRRQLHRPAGLPAGDRPAGRRPRLALGRGPGHRVRAAARARGLGGAARLARRRRHHAVRRGRGLGAAGRRSPRPGAPPRSP